VASQQGVDDIHADRRQLPQHERRGQARGFAKFAAQARRNGQQVSDHVAV